MLPLGAWLTTSLFYEQKTTKSLTTIALFSAKVNFEKILHPETLTDAQLGATITVAMTWAVIPANWKHRKQWETRERHTIWLCSTVETWLCATEVHLETICYSLSGSVFLNSDHPCSVLIFCYHFVLPSLVCKRRGEGSGGGGFILLYKLKKYLRS